MNPRPRRELDENLLRGCYPGETMLAGDFARLIRSFRASRFCSAGILQTDHGEKQRESVGLASHGTVWFATTEQSSYGRGHASGVRDDEQHHDILVPANELPYEAVLPTARDPLTGRRTSALFDQDRRRFRVPLMRGWRLALEDLAKQGFLRPSDELSYLLGRDSRELVPRVYWDF